ncbi:MAG: DUF4199 domain-containing protein [Muribaculum sp.]|nr:DUF4199 domain-containing protein [Muribaculum sp.]MDE6458228.1 DUF4199 domain-containing protein [Muribaculum sp.]
MSSVQSTNQSPYSRGASFGVIFGAYLSLLFFAIAYSLTVPVLSLLSLLLMAGVPVVIYVMLRKSYIADYGKTIFSSLWMEGIAIFFFGGLIASLVAVAYMTWINPGYLYGQVDMMIELYDNADWERGKELSAMLVRAKEQHLIPTPINLAVDMLWLIVFSGSILSMLMSLLVQARGYGKKRVN